MKWYVAEIIVGCRVGKASAKRMLYDRQIKVLRASTDEEAYERALEVGRAENQSYKNSFGQKVSWKFLGLGNLQELHEDAISLFLTGPRSIVAWSVATPSQKFAESAI